VVDYAESSIIGSIVNRPENLEDPLIAIADGNHFAGQQSWSHDLGVRMVLRTMLSSEPTTAVSMSTFVLSSERNEEEALRNKNSEDKRYYVVLIILVVKNQLPLALTLMVDVGAAVDNLYYMISSSQFHVVIHCCSPAHSTRVPLQHQSLVARKKRRNGMRCGLGCHL
jgi:hypothetical protein